MPKSKILSINPMPWKSGSKALKFELPACEAISGSTTYNDTGCCVKIIGVTVNGGGNKVGVGRF